MRAFNLITGVAALVLAAFFLWWGGVFVACSPDDYDSRLAIYAIPLLVIGVGFGVAALYVLMRGRTRNGRAKTRGCGSRGYGRQHRSIVEDPDAAYATVGCLDVENDQCTDPWSWSVGLRLACWACLVSATQSLRSL